jgi:hypothetical protein
MGIVGKRVKQRKNEAGSEKNFEYGGSSWSWS